MRNRERQRGGVLFVAVVTMMLAVALAYATVSITTVSQRDIKQEERELQAHALADAGAGRAIAFVNETMALDPSAPLLRLDQLIQPNPTFTTAHTGWNPADRTTWDVVRNDPTTWCWLPVPVPADTPIPGGDPNLHRLEKNGRRYGHFVTIITYPNTEDGLGAQRDLLIEATGYTLRSEALAAGGTSFVLDQANGNLAATRSTVQALLRVGEGAGEVFDFGYFINNWGWFNNDKLNAYGNVGANGQFDSVSCAPGVFATPRYDSISLLDPTHPDLVSYRDDNGDLLQDGNDGGIYSAWDVLNSGSVLGTGGEQRNQHDFMAPLPMPNLSDLTVYEADAVLQGTSVQIGGGLDAFGLPLPPVTVSDAVLGDGAGEMSNLVLIGTADQPIILNGPVVVRGDVIIKGVVTGKGSIYAGGNVYIADNVTYLNPPTSLLPVDETEASTEAWLAANYDKDFLGLYAREHVVMGDYTDSNWQSQVGSWINSPMNESAEDAGTDQIPSTLAGHDGVMGTEDDDPLEGDGVFTVEYYTLAQANLGLLPPGKAVGDPIPGTGEDIDGDGQYDGAATLAEFDIAAALDSGLWAGNLPTGTTLFGQISSITMTDVQAAVYTNHAAAMITQAYGQDFRFFGSLVSRNESLIFGTNTMNFVHDRRLLGGGTVGSLLPHALQPLRVLAWQRIDEDVRSLVRVSP